MADVVQSDYEALAQIADRFSQQSAATGEMLQSLNSAFTPLRDGEWIGEGADSFFAEMEELVLPSVRRLSDALAQAADVTRQITQVLQDAEGEASAGFKNGSSGGGNGATSVVGDFAATAGGVFGPASGRLGSLGGSSLSFSPGGLGSRVGGAFGSGGFVPSDMGQGALENIVNGRGFTPNGAFGSSGAGSLGSSLFGNDSLFDSSFGNTLGAGPFGGLDSGGSFGIPNDWLSGVTDSLNGYTGQQVNDFGIPNDWLSGVSDALEGGSPADTMGVEVGGETGGSGGGGGGPSGGGGSAGGGGPAEPLDTKPEEKEPASTGGGGGGSSPQTDIGDPFGQRSQFTGNSQSIAAASGDGNKAPGGLRYQALSMPVSGGGSGPAAPAAAVPISTNSGGGGAAPAAPAAESSSVGIPIGIAALSPFLAVLGKAIMGKSDDR